MQSFCLLRNLRISPVSTSGPPTRAKDAYLWFNDRQCFGEQTLPLPEDKRYRVELIDVWNMTRTVLEENARGATKLRLPGKEGLAVLATRID